MPEPECKVDAAYQALSTAFTFPTPAPLAAALSELTYAYEPHPFTLVLLAQAGAVTGALSVAEPGENGLVFAGAAPDFQQVWGGPQGMQNLAPQAQGRMRLSDSQGVIDLELTQIRWYAKPDATCDSLWAALDAQIPVSQGPVILHLAGGDVSVGELAGDNGDPDVTGYPVHAWFAGEGTSFDFTTVGGP